MNMRDDNAIVREALLTIRQELDRRGLSMKVCAAKAQVSYSTFLSWFPAAGTPQIPSMACLDALLKALPVDLASLLAPDGWQIVRVPVGIDHDEIERAVLDYAATKAAAHHPESECGREIGPGEQAELDSKVAYLPIAGKLAA